MAGLASQQALEASTNELLAQAAGMDEAGLSALADELTSVAALLAGQPHLRRMLTENTVDAEAKQALVTRLLDGKVSAPTLKAVTGAVSRRWSSGHDLTDGVRRLSRTATFVQAERSGDLDEVEDQIFRFGRILDASPELSVILDNPATAADARIDLVSRLLAGKVHRLTLALLTSLARDLGGRTYAYGLATLVAQAAERRDKLVATVTSAIALSVTETDRLRAALREIYSREIAVHVVMDPGIGGGLKVRVGDEVIDGSVAGRLDAIRQRLAP